MTHTVTICRTCPAAKALLAGLSQALHDSYRITTTECMSGCTRASTVAFRAPGKTAYLFGDLSAEDLPDLITFARLYAATTDGTFTDARPLGSLRTKAVARIPA